MAPFCLMQASTSRQSKSKVFFSRLARKRRAAQVGESKEEELEAQLEEDGIEDPARNIINEVGLIHPIMFDTYNLCDLVLCILHNSN